jgi:hypothetical protein
MRLGQIAQHWSDSQEFIEYQGFHLPDDTIIPISFNREGKTLHPQMGSAIHIADLPRSYLDNWDGGTLFCELATEDLRIVAGERHSHGSGGFVAVTHKSSASLSWLVLLDWSNPFTGLRLVGSEIEATSSLDRIWRFPLNRPFGVLPPEDDDY